MLVLKRKPNERILLSDGVVITFLTFVKGGVKLGIEAPQDIRVMREELLENGFISEQTHRERRTRGKER